MRPGRARAWSRPDGLALREDPDVLCVDTYQDAPADMARWGMLNPFHAFESPCIPVAGGRLSRSVEAAWQAPKLLDGITDWSMLTARVPTKRPPDNAREGFDYAGTRFRYGDDDVDIVSARYLIYLPAYLHVVDRMLPEDRFDEIVGHLSAGRDVAFYDWDDSTDIDDPARSFSHSALLAAYFAGSLEPLLSARAALVAKFGGEAPALDRYRRLHAVPHEGDIA